MSDLESEKLKALSLAEAEADEEEEFEDDDDEEFEEDETLEEIEIDTELFASQIAQFSCFAELPRDKAPDELFDLVYSAYEEENLTEEQDHVIEFLIHTQEEESPFNLNRALEVWSREDRHVFIGILKTISDSIEDE